MNLKLFTVFISHLTVPLSNERILLKHAEGIFSKYIWLLYLNP